MLPALVLSANVRGDSSSGYDCSSRDREPTRHEDEAGVPSIRGPRHIGRANPRIRRSIHIQVQVHSRTLQNAGLEEAVRNMRDRRSRQRTKPSKRVLAKVLFSWRVLSIFK